MCTMKRFHLNNHTMDFIHRLKIENSLTRRNHSLCQWKVLKWQCLKTFCITLSHKMLTLLPLQLHLTDLSFPIPAILSPKDLGLQCCLASLQTERLFLSLRDLWQFRHIKDYLRDLWKLHERSQRILVAKQRGKKDGMSIVLIRCT